MQATYHQIGKEIVSSNHISTLQVIKDKKYQSDRAEDQRDAEAPRAFAYFKTLCLLNGDHLKNYELKTIGYFDLEAQMAIQEKKRKPVKKKRNKTHREIMKENKDLFRKKVKKIKNEN